MNALPVHFQGEIGAAGKHLEFQIGRQTAHGVNLHDLAAWVAAGASWPENAVARPIEQNYQSLIRQLRDRNAVGVVVAVNGRIIWADIFASTNLLEKYWPKLVRSYASEAIVTRAKDVEVNTSRAQAFLEDMEGRKETIESEPGIYRHTEVNGDGFKAFALTSLLPKTGFDVHVAKMAE